MLVSGGRNGSNVFSDIWLFDPQLEKWEEVRMSIVYIFLNFSLNTIVYSAWTYFTHLMIDSK